MKKVLLIVMFMTALFEGFSQTRGISYQAVILSPTPQEIPGLDAQRNILANSTIAIQFTIVDASGSEVFQEYHTTSTDRYGMINLSIGNGTTTYSSFNDIVWDGTTKKLKVGIDFSGGSNFSPLSEQNLSYMPQPVSNETAQIINGNKIAITAIERNQTTQNSAIALNTAKSGITTAQATTISNTTGVNTGDQDISGIATNATAISAIETDQTTQNSAIALNTAKSGITTAQATTISNTTGVNTGDQDLTSFATLASPSFTGTVVGISKGMVGLGDVDNTSDATKNAATATLTNKTLTSPIISTITNTGTLTLPTTTGTIALTSDITSATGNFVDLTTAQTIAGVKTFSSNASFNGQTIGKGNATGGENLAVGAGAMNGVSTGVRNTAIGNSAMQNYVGTSFDNNTSVGYANLKGMTTGSGNTSVGAESMMALTTGTENTSVGNQSLINTTGNNNVGIGKRAGQTISTGSQNTIIGTDSDVATNSLSNATAIGYGAIVSTSNKVQIGNAAVTAVQLGTGNNVTLETGLIKLTGGTPGAGKILTSDANGLASWSTPATGITSDQASAITANTAKVGITSSQAAAITTNTTDIASIASNVVDLTTNQTVAGDKSFSSDVTLANGNSLRWTSDDVRIEATTASDNMKFYVGNTEILKLEQANLAATFAGDLTVNGMTVGKGGGAVATNTANGYLALSSNTTGAANTANGYNALSSNTTGSYNTAIGDDADVSSGNLSNATALGNGATVSASNTIQLGNTSVTNVKTSGTITAGAITIPNTDGTSGQVLSTNGSGAVSWTNAPTGTVSSLSDLSVTATASELNIMDGSATTQATVTLVGTDGIVISDGDIMKQALMSDIKTYVEGGSGVTHNQVVIDSWSTPTTELAIGDLKFRVDNGYLEWKSNTGSSINFDMEVTLKKDGSGEFNSFPTTPKVGHDSSETATTSWAQVVGSSVGGADQWDQNNVGLWYYGTITYELFQRYGVNKSYTIKTAVDGGGKVFIRATYYNFE